MKLKNIFFFTYFLFISSVLFAQKEVKVYSESMKREIDNSIFLPQNYNESKKDFPVLYLLHGHGGNHNTWGKIKKDLPEDATKYQMIIVCPNGENSWYWDSPKVDSLQFETYVSKELVNYIDSTYHTKTTPKGRAIAGLSMGGHGALWLAINHPNIFGACGSMSGGLDIRPFPDSWNMKNSLGNYAENKDLWNSHTVINQLSKIEPNQLKIIIDCGYDDFFFKVNEETHRQMLYNNIEHDYIVRPGKHNQTYWKNAIDFQLVFFDHFFNQQ